MSDEFVAYVGPYDVHDGRIVRVNRAQDTITVSIRTETGRLFDMVFVGVTDYHAMAAEAMILYAVAEMRGFAPQGKFVFANWDYDDPAELTVVASGFQVADSA